MDVSQLSDVELKAIAYDELMKLQAIQANLDIINQELARRSDAGAVPPMQPLKRKK